MADASTDQTSAPLSIDAGELAALRGRLAVLEQRDSRRRRITTACAIGIVLTAGTIAMAAPGDCPNGMPFCFAPDAPAVAAQVNENFAYLRGQNAAWVRTGTSITINPGPRVVVGSVTVPAGNYVVSGKLYGVTSAGGNLLCILTSGATNLDTTNAHPSNNYAHLSLLGSIALPTGGTFAIECSPGANGYTIYGLSMVARPVSVIN